jgi:VIT1/CCC1 family predicted Fe2+/Mn2+ transporter
MSVQLDEDKVDVDRDSSYTSLNEDDLPMPYNAHEKKNEVNIEVVEDVNVNPLAIDLLSPIKFVPETPHHITDVHHLVLDTPQIPLPQDTPKYDVPLTPQQLPPSPEQDMQSIEPKIDTTFNITDYIKSATYGGMDGITSVFVTVATIFSGNILMSVVLIIGLAKLVSGAIAMGVGDFMSSKAEMELIRVERKRELWECENFLRGEMEEMVSIYQEKGLKEETAKDMVNLMSGNRQAFVDVMMVQELGLKSTIDPWGPVKGALVNFFAFVICGSIPLILYIVMTIVVAIWKIEVTWTIRVICFVGDALITFIALITMGFLRARFSDQKWYIAVAFTVIVGVVSAGSGYLVAFGLDKIFHLN